MCTGTLWALSQTRQHGVEPCLVMLERHELDEHEAQEAHHLEGAEKHERVAVRVALPPHEVAHPQPGAYTRPLSSST